MGVLRGQDTEFPLLVDSERSELENCLYKKLVLSGMAEFGLGLRLEW